MSENLNYISDEELERLIAQVEQEELVAAPPDLLERILDAESENSYLMCCETSSILKEESTRTSKVSLMTDEFSGRPVDLSSVKSTADRKKEFHAYCFRVITSVAAAVMLVFLLPELTNWMNLNGILLQKQSLQNVPNYEKVVVISPSKEEVVEEKTVPSKAEITEGNTVPSKSEITAGEVVPSKAKIVDGTPVPSKETVLQDIGFIEKVINSTRWFNKESDTQ